MEKIVFDIIKIKVSKSMDGFGLDIILRSDMHLKTTFQDQQLYDAALEVSDNLTKLKAIFWRQIENILKENPKYFYLQSNCELFHTLHSHILEDVSDGYANVYEDSMDLVKSCAIEKDIEFDGYFRTRWEQSADTIINFDEEYFDDPDRRDLYVFLSALVDEDVFGFLNEAFKGIGKEPVTKELIEEKIRYLTQEKGIRF